MDATIRTLGTLAAGLCLLGALGTAPRAAAQADNRESLELARQHMELGESRYQAGEFDEAAAEFLKAYDARPFSAFLYNAAVAYERAGQRSKAVDYYRQYLIREPNARDADAVRAKIASETGGEAPPVGEAGEAGEAGREMKSLLSIQTRPEGATVVVEQGGVEVATGPAPFAQTLDEGDYRLVIKHPDYRTVSQDVKIRQGKVYVVIVEMSQGQFLGYMRVVSDPPGAKVYVDKREEGSLGRTPFQNVFPTGPHTVWVDKPGYQVEERKVDLGLGENLEVRTTLTRLDYGRLRVVANVAGAAVLVDGKAVGLVPWDGHVPHGDHVVTVRADSMKDWKGKVHISKGQLTPVRVELRPAVPRGAAWATGAIGVVTLGGAITMAVLTKHLDDDLARDRDAGVLASDDSRIRRVNFYAIGADVGFGLTALFGALSLYYGLRDPLPDSTARVLEPRDWTFLPSFDPVHGGGSATLRWRF